MHAQDDETNDNDNEIDDMPKHTTTMEKHLIIPVGELGLVLVTQENPAKNLLYITNMPEHKLEINETCAGSQ